MKKRSKPVLFVLSNKLSTQPSLLPINLILTNLHGLWALLAIPLIVLIHFLQRRAKVQLVSTLFLLRQTQRESTSGRRFDRLVNSVPLWLQILAVLLLTWLLVQPRYVKAKSTQRIAIVLDSSASMRVFKDGIPTVIKQEIPRLQGNAANVEIWLLESDPSKPKIYQGSSTDDLLKALEKWTPNSGATEPGNTLRVARSLVGAEGALTYITDTPLDYAPPYNTSLISIGEPRDNVGITGVSFEQRDDNLIWKAVIRNYSDTDQQRTWLLETPKGKSKPHTFTLHAGQLTTIQGAFPSHSPRCQIVLSSDNFTLDDTLPLVRPAPKPLLVFSTLSKDTIDLSDRMMRSFPNLKQASTRADADLVITSTATTPTHSHLIVFPRDKATNRPYLTGNIVATKHPLTDGLNWQTLLVRSSISLPHTKSDDVLLWQGNRPLIYLRTHPTSGKKALILNFDINKSNALKQPSIAVLLLRFCEQLRKEKIAPESRITETSEPLELTRHRGKKSPPLTYTILALDATPIEIKNLPPNTSPLTAPDSPGFFTITQGKETLLTSAAYFADTREADFSQCATDELRAPTLATAVDRHTRDDHLWRVWACLTLACLLGAWFFTKPSEHLSIHSDRHG